MLMVLRFDKCFCCHIQGSGIWECFWELCLLGHIAGQSVESQSEGATSLMLVSYLAYFWTLKMEVINSSETLVEGQRKCRKRSAPKAA
jgi:hypothetical protein